MPLSRFVALIGFAFAVGLALGGGRWAISPLLVCWSVASQRDEDDMETAGTTSGKLSEVEVQAAFRWRLAPLIPDSQTDSAGLSTFDSGEWAAREAKRRCGGLALLLSVCVGGSYYSAKWVSRREEAAGASI
jgi:hypothetical protein